MKKFSEEFAADFKQKKDTDAEVSDAEVRSKGEKEFKDKPLTIEASFGFSAKVPKEHRLVNPELGG